jgi:hypothetical protein
MIAYKLFRLRKNGTIEDYYEYSRPRAQGTKWYIAQKLRIID